MPPLEIFALSILVEDPILYRARIIHIQGLSGIQRLMIALCCRWPAEATTGVKLVVAMLKRFPQHSAAFEQPLLSLTSNHSSTKVQSPNRLRSDLAYMPVRSKAMRQQCWSHEEDETPSTLLRKFAYLHWPGKAWCLVLSGIDNAFAQAVAKEVWANQSAGEGQQLSEPLAELLLGISATDGPN